MMMFCDACCRHAVRSHGGNPGPWPEGPTASRMAYEHAAAHSHTYWCKLQLIAFLRSFVWKHTLAGLTRRAAGGLQRRGLSRHGQHRPGLLHGTHTRIHIHTNSRVAGTRTRTLTSSSVHVHALPTMRAKPTRVACTCGEYTRMRAINTRVSNAHIHTLAAPLLMPGRVMKDGTRPEPPLPPPSPAKRETRTRTARLARERLTVGCVSLCEPV
jgi:hypothetical protein